MPLWRKALPVSLVCMVAFAHSSAGQTDAPRSPRNANYTISARLDARAHTITAQERITWRNITNAPTSELQFHVYWNAWADTKSTWRREKARSQELDRSPADFSRIDISSIQLLGATPQTLSNRRFIAPDDGNGDDRTVMTVALPAPAQPGQTLEVSVDWTAKVPRTFDRTGVIGTYFFIAQWFPKLGVLEDTGWNTHQFHSGTEFYSDYGVYDVSLAVPSGWVVGATGSEQSRTNNNDGTTTHRFVQEDVHDFAWTTSPDFIERTARFEETGLPPVQMRLLMQPEHLGQAERHFAATRSALRRYGSWFGPYPYGHLTIVDPAFQSDTGGMEYPTLITAGTQWLVARQVTLQTPEEVVVHEAGHQFWYGISGNNEFEHAWMDEGINTYAAARALASDYPEMYLDRYYFGGFVPWVFKDVRLSRDTDLNRIWPYRAGPTDDTMGSASYRQRPETIGVLAYDKPAVWLNTLERWLGWTAVQGALHAAFSEAAFRHPAPDVVLHAVQRSAGHDLTRFYDQTYRGSAVFDYSIEKLASESAGPGQFASRVLVRRLGDGVFPVDILVTFDNGEQITEHWNGEDRWREFTYTRASRVRSAIVDPNRQLLLDVNFTNNSRTRQPRAEAAARKWTLKWVVWLQDALLTWGLFA